MKQEAFKNVSLYINVTDYHLNYELAFSQASIQSL